MSELKVDSPSIAHNSDTVTETWIILKKPNSIQNAIFD